MSQDQSKQEVTAGLPFEDHLRSVTGAFRTAILELMSSVGADPGRPQEVARRFGLRAGLTWKVCKVAQEPDVHAAVIHIPGATGLKLFVDALEKAGAAGDSVRAARCAGRDFEKMVEIHTGDRATLEMMIGGMSPGRTEQNRKLAYQGNSGTWGVRARAQMSLKLLAPSQDDPEQCDLVQVAGLIGFRRLRRDARWLLFRRERWSDEMPQEEDDRWEPLDPTAPAHSEAPLVADFCSKPLPKIEVIHGAGEEQYELPDGPIGNTAAMNCIYGLVARACGPSYTEVEGSHIELGVNLITPVENLLMDTLIHRDCDWAMRPEVALYSRLDGGAIHPAERRQRNILPVPEPIHDLGWGARGLATPHMPDYTRLVSHTFRQLGWDPNDFRAFRLTMTYPPIPTAALVRVPLPIRAASV